MYQHFAEACGCLRSSLFFAGYPLNLKSLPCVPLSVLLTFFCCILYVIKRLPEKCHCQSVFLTLNLRPCGKFGLPHLSKSTAAARTVQQSYLGV